jgi:DNA uptake protein ComE-like DNA-binding protein
MKNGWKDYLTFTKKERIGIVVLMLVLLLFLLLPEIYQPDLPTAKIDTSLVSVFASKPSAEKAAYAAYEKEVANSAEIVDARKFKLFMFDPNTASETQWLELGIKPRTVKTILNYRNKGGRFRAATDIKKIWGIAPADAQRLIPYVRIAPVAGSQNSSNNYYAQKAGSANWTNAGNAKGVYQSKVAIIEINTANQQDWKALPGIGSVLAARIIKFRDKLGGFKEIAQVGKTYGIADSLFQKIAPYLKLTDPIKDKSSDPTGSVKSPGQLINSTNQLDINKATVGELLAAEIPEGVAKAIVLYRKQHGAYTRLADLKNIVFINEGIYNSIIPKLMVQ